MKGLSADVYALLALIRYALWETIGDIPNDVDWDLVEQLAREQGVLWMLYAGSSPYSDKIPPELLKKWRQIAFSGILRNERINRIQNKVLMWLYENNVRAAVLKGTSCARYYLYPHLRRLGDIDVLLDEKNIDSFGAYLESQGYERSTHECDFHVGYYNREAVIEVHRAGTEIPDSEGGHVARDIMAGFLNDIQMVNIDEMWFPALSESHQALMLVLHLERHMIENGIGFRQLSDWAVFAARSGEEHWYNGTLNMLADCGLLYFAKAITRVCVEYLGLDQEKVHWCVEVPGDLTDRMMYEILRGGSVGAADREGMGSLFSDRKTLGQKRRSALQGFISTMNRISIENFPWMKKYTFILPAAWIYLLIRYWLRVLSGKRYRKSIIQIVDLSNQRQKLYKDLKLYEID